MIICLVQFAVRPNPDYDEVASYLRLEGHEVWVTRFTEDNTFVWDDGNLGRIEQGGPWASPGFLPKVRFVNIAWKHSSDFEFVQRVRRVIRELEPDIVQVNSNNMRYNSLIPRTMPEKAVFILDFRQIGDRRRPTSPATQLRNKMRSSSRRVSAKYSYDHSCYLHSAGAEFGLGDNWKQWGTVVPMGVHDRFQEPFDIADTTAKNSSVVRFVYVGTIDRIRRLETIFSAISYVKDRTNRFEVHFLGRDESDGYYQELAYRLQLEPYVRFVPPVPYDEVPRKLSGYDVALAYVPNEPTDWTYHPTLKILEYHAIGIPIIATDVPPNREIVKPGFNGYLCQNTADDIGQAMLQLILDRHFLERISGNAKLCRKGVSWREVSRMYENLYARLLSDETI